MENNFISNGEIHITLLHGLSWETLFPNTDIVSLKNRNRTNPLKIIFYVLPNKETKSSMSKENKRQLQITES